MGLLIAIGAVLALLADSAAWAYDRNLQVGQYQHRAWLAKDGAPAPIRAIAQATDGALWLGSEEGLVRFDGQQFEVVPTPGGADASPSVVSALLVQADGGVWVGFRRGGGLGFLKDGKFQRIASTLKKDVQFVAQDPQGTVWFVLDTRLYRLEGKTALPVDAGWNMTEEVRTYVMDRAGTLWIGDMKGGLHMLPLGQRHFIKVTDRFEGNDLAADSDGGVWGSGLHGVWHAAVKDGRPSRIRQGPANLHFGTMMFDSAGGMWIQRVGGLSRESDPTVVLDGRGDRQPAEQVFSVQQGLSSETILAYLEDRDGNVWTATSKGLDRFRRTPLTPVRLPGAALSSVMAPAMDGGVWAANWRGGAMKVGDHTVEEFPDVGPGTRFLYKAPDGALWSGGSGLWRTTDEKRFQKVAIDPNFIGDVLRAMAIDRHGDMWITGGGSSATARVSRGVWSVPSEADGFPPKWSARCMATDADGQLWACAGADPLRVDNGKARRLSSIAPGLDIGQVTVLQFYGRHLWLGGHTGVAVFDGHRVVNLKRKDGQPFKNIGGIVETADGDVWLHDRAAALRIPAEDVRAALAGGGAVAVQTLGEADGMYGMVSNTAPLPSLIQGKDGRLWFASDAGLAWLDPAAWNPPASMPVVEVRSLTADGVSYDVDAPMTLAPRNRRVEISYAAVALSTPERVKFRYRLEGIGGGWQEAGVRRAAYFNDLQPGHYRFEVEASDEYGVWQGHQATLAFQVAPAWFQTWWFRLGCAVLALVGLWGALRVRDRQIARQVTAREEAKQVERNRIARDLHDTFLQSVQGLMYQFQALSARIPTHDPIRPQLDSALDLADRVVAEGRDRVVGLRQEGNGLELSRRLRGAWMDESGSSAPHIEVKIDGEERSLKEHVSDEVFQILREALMNARRHAQASAVSLDLRYRAEQGFVAIVSDNGTGLPTSVLEKGKPGHWGLAGMKERAAVIGATLGIRSGASVGTQVELSLSARQAFEDDRTPH